MLSVSALLCVPPSTTTRTLLWVMLVAILFPTLALPTDAEPVESEAGQSAEKRSWTEKLQLHGHLTTAYADFELDEPRGLFVEEAILGIPEDGTFDYRMAALQLRYLPSPRHSVVVQVSHRRFGDSILHEIEDDLELDWLFWRWKFGDSSALRLGRFPTPAGIFNEVRDVGTLLPFFRPSFNFYREGGIFSETIDGIGLHHTFFDASDWSLDADVYSGSFEVSEQTQGIGAGIREVDSDDAVGFQLWLNTPVQGLRLGLGGLRWDVGAESGLNPVETTWESWYASVDASFERWVARVEYRELQLPLDVAPVFVDGRAELDLYYWQLGWYVTPKLSLFVQSEYADFTQFHEVVLDGSFRYNNRRDEGVAVGYRLRPGWVAKAEFHSQRLDTIAGTPVFTDQGLRIRVDTEEFESEYLIVSVSYSF